MREEDYRLDFFSRNALSRKKCRVCGRYFWSSGSSELCGETPCVDYSFIGHSPMRRRLSLSQMREEFLSFLESEGHKRVRRYPIVARWRDDVFYTQASIYPFQPWVIDGISSPPANPLGISQTCVRFNDIDNVGKTGQHFTMFEMMAHHVFNRGKFIYFKERTVEICHEFLTKRLGVEPTDIAYIEGWWEGGGNAGPCFEVTLGGAEVATLVFMIYREDNGKRSLMDTTVVDTGYGLERLAWISQGTPSSYEATFGRYLTELKRLAGVETDKDLIGQYSKLAGKMKVGTPADIRKIREETARNIGMSLDSLLDEILPLEKVYVICDHLRALIFILNDGVVPSNVKEGYFARLLVRKAMRAMHALSLDVEIEDLLANQIRHLSEDFPELKENEESIIKLASIEKSKYEETLSKGKNIVRNLERALRKRGKRIGSRELVELYDSHGLTPEVVKDFSAQEIVIPEDFYAKVAARHEELEEEAGGRVELPPSLPPTRLRFYEDKRKKRFRAKVLAVLEDAVILDQTYFYPEGGGQESDRGEIGQLRVTDVQKIGNVVLHRTSGRADLELGATVICQIDWDRRLTLMRHHTATHIVNGAARRVLGEHVWQAGAHKSEEMARLDITHYQNLTREEFAEIERLANRVVLDNLQIKAQIMSRDAAERKHGFRLYQGGCVPGGEIRVVDIAGWDTEACGGIHCTRTSEVGSIRLLRARRIQDGVLRLEFVAGVRAVEYTAKQSLMIREMSRKLNVKPEELPISVEKSLDELGSLRKEVRRLKESRAAAMVEELMKSAEKVGDVRVLAYLSKGSMVDLMTISKQIPSHKKVVAILGSTDGNANLIVVRSDDVDVDCSKIAKIASREIGGKGGGKPDFAQGGGPRAERISSMLEVAKKETVKVLRTHVKGET